MMMIWLYDYVIMMVLKKRYTTSITDNFEKKVDKDVFPPISSYQFKPKVRTFF